MIFLAVTRLILEKNNIFYPFFTYFFKKINIISGVIIPIAAIFKNVFYNFFVTLQGITMPSFMSKAFSYQDLTSGELCAPLHR